MSRDVLVRLVGIAIVAVLAVLCWRIFGPSGMRAEAMPSPQVIETKRLMDQWQKYAKEEPPLSRDRLTPGEAVDVMNVHSTLAFPERTIRFQYWQPGMPPPPGYIPNPSAKPFQGDDGKLPKSTHQSLHGRTDRPLRDARFRFLVIGETGYVYPWDAFEPHLITRHLVFSRSVASLPRLTAPVSIKGLLEMHGIEMGPGKRADLSPDGFHLDLCVDEADLERSLEALKTFGLHSQDSSWKRLKRSFRDARDEARRRLFFWLP